MPRNYVIVAGPQAAGKSTAISRLCGEMPGMIPLEESRQIVVHKHQRKGAIFMTRDDEIEVIHHDMQRMFHILDQDKQGGFYIDETNVFTLGHARAHGIDLLDGYFKQYCDMLAGLNARVLFLDVPPGVSWNRRWPRYLQRLWDCIPEERERGMAKYKEYLFRLYPELLAIYNSLELPKMKIDASVSPQLMASASLRGLSLAGRHPHAER